jgi:hypothetical protein
MKRESRTRRKVQRNLNLPNFKIRQDLPDTIVKPRPGFGIRLLIKIGEVEISHLRFLDCLQLSVIVEFLISILQSI